MRTMRGGPCSHYDCSNRNSFGYCKTTVCINEHYQQEQWGVPSTTNNCESVVIKQQTKIKTNGDKIRAMSDEELAEKFADGCCRDVQCEDKYLMPDGLNCYGCWLDWLKEEVKEWQP